MSVIYFDKNFISMQEKLVKLLKLILSICMYSYLVEMEESFLISKFIYPYLYVVRNSNLKFLTFNYY